MKFTELMVGDKFKCLNGKKNITYTKLQPRKNEPNVARINQTGFIVFFTDFTEVEKIK